jgi:hypothetical protein
VVNPEVRLAQVAAALDSVGLSYLVMGGHAVRFYGISRNTIDYDLHVSPQDWDNLPERLGQTPLFAGRPPFEGPTWRPLEFRRFRLGQLDDGRDEWLEFWHHNHLLAPFAELSQRCERGEYGGRVLPFLALLDLIRSKETQRHSDWQDVALLEEVLDARLLAQARTGTRDRPSALAWLRSRIGFENYLQEGYLRDPEVVRRAILQSKLSITQAYLLPGVPDATGFPGAAVPIEPVIERRLRAVSPGSPLHLTLVEAVRRQYMMTMQAADRADKEAIRAAQANPPPNTP